MSGVAVAVEIANATKLVETLMRDEGEISHFFFIFHIEKALQNQRIPSGWNDPFIQRIINPTSPSVYASPWYRPREPLRVPGSVARPVRLPVLEYVLEVEQLVVQADAAVGVHGGDPGQVLAVLAEAAEDGRVEEPHPGANVRPHALLDDLVEHVLLVLPREPCPRRLPVLVERHGGGQRPDVEEAAVGEVPR
jgi:hypothetical protein